MKIDFERAHSPHDLACLLLVWLENRGAIITLGADDRFLVDLDPIVDFGANDPDVLSMAVLALRDEIRTILIARRTLH